jgi:hypothetical protein
MNPQGNSTGYWKIASGEGGYIWPEQRDSKVISVGWSEVGSLKKYGSNDEKFKRDFERLYDGNGQQLWRFYKEVKKNDRVIACAGNKIFGYGQIDGDYEFRKDLHYGHCRKVTWEKLFWSPLSVDDLNTDYRIKRLFQIRAYKKTVRHLDIGKLTGYTVFEKITKAIRSRRNGVEDLIEWEGLHSAPKSEQETIVFFSKMSPVLRMKISFVGTRYPDAIIRVKKWKSWVTKTAEFEFLASSFRDHEEKYRSGNRCDMIICWENDWSHKPKWLSDTTQIVELKKELEKII